MQITGGELPRFMDRDDSNDENREYNRQHGEQLFKMLLEEIGNHRLIAEDLGEVAPYCDRLWSNCRSRVSKSRSGNANWERLIPGDDYQRLSLATYATHDHPPVKSHWDELFLVAQSEDQTLRDAAIHGMWELMDFCGKPNIELPQAFTPHPDPARRALLQQFLDRYSHDSRSLWHRRTLQRARVRLRGQLDPADAFTCPGMGQRIQLTLKLVRQSLSQTGRSRK